MHYATRWGLSVNCSIKRRCVCGWILLSFPLLSYSLFPLSGCSLILMWNDAEAVTCADATESIAAAAAAASFQRSRYTSSPSRSFGDWSNVFLRSNHLSQQPPLCQPPTSLSSVSASVCLSLSVCVASSVSISVSVCSFLLFCLYSIVIIISVCQFFLLLTFICEFAYI